MCVSFDKGFRPDLQDQRNNWLRISKLLLLFLEVAFNMSPGPSQGPYSTDLQSVRLAGRASGRLAVGRANGACRASI